MGWETRKGRDYYYLATWEDGRCVKRYYGTGAAAKAAADHATALSEQRMLEGIAALRFEKSILAAEQLFVEASGAAGDLMKASLLADGFYQASHTWRRRRR